MINVLFILSILVIISLVYLYNNVWTKHLNFVAEEVFNYLSHISFINTSDNYNHNETNQERVKRYEGNNVVITYRVTKNENCFIETCHIDMGENRQLTITCCTGKVVIWCWGEYDKDTYTHPDIDNHAKYCINKIFDMFGEEK